MKLRRRLIHNRYANVIDGLYAPTEGGDPCYGFRVTESPS